MNIFGRFIEFEHPEFLYWSWVPPLVVAGVCVVAWLLMRAQRNAYADPAHLSRTTRAESMVGFIARTLLWSFAAFLVMVALSEPFENNADVTVPEGSLNVVTIFDVSNSMATEDYRFVLPTEDGGPPLGPWGSRLQMSKEVFTEQIFHAIPGNKIGMVTFTGEGYSQAPLCEDYGTLRFILSKWMGLLSAPGDGSDYIQGMRTAIDTLRRDFDPSKRQVILLFSDGGTPSFEDDEARGHWQQEFGKMTAELEALRKESGGKLHVVVVGVGSRTEQMIPIYNPANWERVDWFPQGKEEKAKTKVEEAGLKQLAEATGGHYIWLATDGSAKMPIDWASTLGGTKTVKGKNPLDFYPLAAAMAVLALLFLRGAFRRPDQIASSPGGKA